MFMVKFPFKTQNKPWFLLLNTMLAKEKISEVRSSPQSRNLLTVDKRHSKEKSMELEPNKWRSGAWEWRWGPSIRLQVARMWKKQAGRQWLEACPSHIANIVCNFYGYRKRREVAVKAWDVCAHPQYYGAHVRGMWLSPSFHDSQV